jgi:predicted small lipoprotein YifL
MARCTATLLGLAALVLAGCGQKGALYLPDKSGTVVTSPAPAPQQSAPSDSTPSAVPSQSTAPKKADPDDDSQPPQ